MKKITKKLTKDEKIQLLVDLLKHLQKVRYHEPNSDLREYCVCGWSPYFQFSEHALDCLTVRIRETLKVVVS